MIFLPIWAVSSTPMKKKVSHTDGVAGQEFDSFVNRGIRFFTDLQKIRNKGNQILEGEIL